MAYWSDPQFAYTHQNAIIDEICVNKMSMDLGHLGVLDALIYRF